MSTVYNQRRSSLVCMSLLHMAMPLMAMSRYEPSSFYKGQYSTRNYFMGEGKTGLVQLLAPVDNGIDYLQKPYKEFASLLPNRSYPDKESNFMKKKVWQHLTNFRKMSGEGKTGLVQLLAPVDNGIDYLQKPYKEFASLSTNQIYPDKDSNFMKKKMEDDIFTLNFKTDIGRGRRAISGVLPLHALALRVAMASLEPDYNKYNNRLEFYDDGIEKLDHKPKGFLRFGR